MSEREVVPRGRLGEGDVVKVYHCEGSKHHHTDSACRHLTKSDTPVESYRVAVDAYGGLQVGRDLCGDCDPFYHRVEVGDD